MNAFEEVITILKEEESERLDALLGKRFKGLYSRSYFQKLIEEGKVLLNGLPLKKRTQLSEGDQIAIQFAPPPEMDLEPQDIPLEIIFEDEFLIVINKPAGLVVHPAVGNWKNTFVNALIHHCKQIQDMTEGNDLRPGIVHRLDKETSGLLIAAKTSLTQQRLIEMFAQRKIHKEYLAIVYGHPGNVKIEEPIGRHPKNRQMMAIRSDGKSAITLCRTLQVEGKLSLVSIILTTGRTHQIRVHMKHLGTPILGDPTYGLADINKKYGAKRQLLHAYHLNFIHPMTGENLSLTAPIPTDMKFFSR